MRLYNSIIFFITLGAAYLTYAADSLMMESSLVADRSVKPGEILFKVTAFNNSKLNLCLIGWPKTAFNDYLLDGLDAERYVFDRTAGVNYIGREVSRVERDDIRMTVLAPLKKMSYIEDISKSYQLSNGHYSLTFYTLYFDCSLLSDSSLDLININDRITGSVRYGFYLGKGMNWVIEREHNNTILSKSKIATSSTKISLPLKYDRIYELECDHDRKEHLRPNSQFKINNDEAFDTVTGLTWKRCYFGQHLSENKCIGEATSVNPVKNEFIDNESAVGTDNNLWRVPNIEELESIVDYVCLTPGLNSAVFPIDINDYGMGSVISSSAHSENGTYYMDFTSGRAFREQPEGSFRPVLLVKGALMFPKSPESKR